MKNIYLILLFLASSLSIFSQKEHFCAVGKQKSSNLKRASSPRAVALMNKYDVKFHHLSLNVTKDTNYVSGNVRTIARVVGTPIDTFVFELQTSMLIDSIKIGSDLLIFQRISNDVYAVLPSTYTTGSDIEITIYYKGYTSGAGSSAIGDGYSDGNSTRWGNAVSWSLSQPFSAYEWFPCKQDLTDKIDSTYFYATCDTPSMSGSNGLLKAIVPMPGGKRQFQWVNIHPIDYYLISVATANYIEYSTYAHPVGSDSVLFQNYIYNNPLTLPTFKGLIDTTAFNLDFFSTIFGPYPFAKQKYGHCLAPFSGGMEHQTMTTQGFFEFSLDAHELGHQWFGDNVTCATWKDIWVNEGFASYSEYLAYEHFYPNLKAGHMQDVHDFVMRQPGGSVWFTDSTNVNRIFSSRLTYNKGSAIIHTLRFVVNNDNLFFQALKNYQNTYKNATATSIDFKNIMQTVSGVNLDDWMNQWFYGEGYPTYSVRWNQVANQIFLNVSHTTSTTVTPLFKTPLELKLIGTSDTIIKINTTTNSDDFIVSLPTGYTISDLEVDPNNWILNEVDAITKDESLATISLPNYPISIYPTVVNTSLNIDNDNLSNLVAKIFSTEGKLISQKVFSGNTTLEMNNISSGNYIVEIQNENGLVLKIQQIVKQ
jgi:aminopeptidase N